MEFAQASKVNRQVWSEAGTGIDKETPDARAVEITSGNFSDAPMLTELPSLLLPEQKIACVRADGVYNTRACLDAISEWRADAVTLSLKNTTPWKSSTAGADKRNEVP